MEDLAKGILLFIKQPDVARIMGERARQTLIGNFDWNSIAHGTAVIYQQIIDNGKVDTSSIRDILHKSYTPLLEESAQNGFVKEGVIHFAQYPDAIPDGNNRGTETAC